MENHGKRWSDNDIKYLFENLKNNTNINNISNYLKRTPVAIYGKLYQISNFLINIIGIDISIVSNLTKISEEDIIKYNKKDKVDNDNDNKISLSSKNIINQSDDNKNNELDINNINSLDDNKINLLKDDIINQTKNDIINQTKNDIINQTKNYIINQTKNDIINQTKNENKEIILNKRQQKAFDEFLKNKNIFITGPAGTGKSITLSKIINYCKENNKKIGITATTGSAALLIGGKTIHSYLGIGRADKTAYELFEDIRYKYKHTLIKIKELEILIIDEISMMDSDLLDKISCFLCLCRKTSEQFGGLQVILTGDFCQLESVNGDFCFNSSTWEKLNLEVIFLNKMIRQSQDKIFQRKLGDLRYGICSDETFELLCECKKTEFKDIKPTILYSRNADVDKINSLEYNKLITNGSKNFIYNIILPDIKKNHEKIKKWIKSLDINESLELCIGAQIVITANINQDKGLVNGTRGKIIDLHSDRIIIQNITGSIELIEYHKCISSEDSTLFFKYMPIKLGYALTIHKSQGMTLDAIEIDIGDKIFASGQAYTALSRAKSLNSIKITSASKSSFIIKSSVIEFYKQYDNTLI